MVFMTGASMALRFGFASLIPLGMAVDSVDEGENTLVVKARSSATTASCPLCGVVSHRVQSHYVRQPSDLPCSGRSVRLRLLVRRFRCGVPGCLREVFAERFETKVLA
jgi:transposase